MNTILGLDIGTNSTKAVLYDFDGREVATASQRLPIIDTPTGLGGARCRVSMGGARADAGRDCKTVGWTQNRGVSTGGSGRIDHPLRFGG